VITAEMIEAGTDVLWSMDLEADPRALIAQEVFLAMIAAVPVGGLSHER
jgi:hypothetical protein